MKLKEWFDKIIDYIDSNRGNITKLLLSILAFISLVVVFFVSSDEMSVGKEVEHLVKSIESRKYQIAYDYYQDIKNEFSPSKMERFNKSASKKINNVVINSGDKYIGGQISKEHFIGIINTVNSLDEISVNSGNIIEQAKRVEKMYIDENVTYDVALSYMTAVSTLNSINDELDNYKQNIKSVYESRTIYSEATNNQQIKNYYEAIEGYNKVIELDKKYYKLAKTAKEECINVMYDYYIQLAKDYNDKGNYEDAIKYIEYLKAYYPEDEKVSQLNEEYQKNLDLYTMSSDDIISLISKKMKTNKEGLSVEVFQQMVNGIKFYYVELYKYEELIDEILVDGKTKKIYSYKSFEKDYNSAYSDGYFKIISNGEFRFALSEGECIFTLENKLKEKKESFKKIEVVPQENISRYINNNDKLEKFIKENNSVYYYALVNKGFFKKKELYLIDMYTKQVYFVEDDQVIEY